MLIWILLILLCTFVLGGFEMYADTLMLFIIIVFISQAIWKD
mgnify:CR=1 FL=1